MNLYEKTESESKQEKKASMGSDTSKREKEGIDVEEKDGEEEHELKEEAAGQFLFEASNEKGKAVVIGP